MQRFYRETRVEIRIHTQTFKDSRVERKDRVVVKEASVHRGARSSEFPRGTISGGTIVFNPRCIMHRAHHGRSARWMAIFHLTPVFSRIDAANRPLLGRVHLSSWQIRFDSIRFERNGRARWWLLRRIGSLAWARLRTHQHAFHHRVHIHTRFLRERPHTRSSTHVCRLSRRLLNSIRDPKIGSTIFSRRGRGDLLKDHESIEGRSVGIKKLDSEDLIVEVTNKLL